MAGPKNKRFPEPPAAGKSFPAGIETRILAALKQFFAARTPFPKRLCVALSGGCDSVVLLHALRQLVDSGELATSLSAIHVHHGLSPQADAWAACCSKLCDARSVPLHVVRVDVARDSGEGLEAAARRARYSAFAVCDADALVLAHHRDDQAETVLLNLLRGAGIAGAAAILPVRRQAQGQVLLRPLLDVERASITAYAHAHKLAWVDDESNDDIRFRRNFLRHEILPALAGQFPGAQQALARAAAHFAECDELLEALAGKDRALALAESGRLSVAALLALPASRARNLLRFVWAEAGFRAPDTRWLAEALAQLKTSDAQAATRVTTADGELRVFRGEIYFLPRQAAAPANRASETRTWCGELELPWAGGHLRFVETTGAGLRRDGLASGELRIRHRQGGERLQPDSKRPRRSLRNLLQEAGMPPWERERLPYLWHNERLLWVGGIGCDAALVAGPGEGGILPIWEG